MAMGGGRAVGNEDAPAHLLYFFAVPTSDIFYGWDKIKRERKSQVGGRYSHPSDQSRLRVIDFSVSELWDFGRRSGGNAEVP